MHGREFVDFWGGPYSLLHPFIVPLFLLGVFYCVWRLRSPLNVFPLYIVATGLGSALMANKWGSPRYIIVMPVMALMIAIGIRYGLALMIPGSTFKKLRNIQISPPTEWRIPFTWGRALMALVVLVTVFHAFYYFGEHLSVFNGRLLSSRPYPDMFDAVDRASREYDPTTTQVIMISAYQADFNLARGMYDFYTWSPMFPLETFPASAIDQTFIEALPRDRNYVFMVEPGLNEVVNRLYATFPTMFPPETTDRDLPPDKIFWAYYAPMNVSR